MPVRLTPRLWDALVWLAALTTSLFVYSFFGAVEIAEFPPLPAKPPAATDETKVVLPDRAAPRAAGLGTARDEEHRLPRGRVAPAISLRSSRPEVTTVTPAGAVRPRTGHGTPPARPHDAALPPEPAPEPPSVPGSEPPSPPPPTSAPPAPSPPPAGETTPPMLPLTQVPALEPLPPAPELDDAGERPKGKASKHRGREIPPPQAQSDERPPVDAPVDAAPPSPSAEQSPPAAPPAEPGAPSSPAKHADKEDKGA